MFPYTLAMPTVVNYKTFPFWKLYRMQHVLMCKTVDKKGQTLNYSWYVTDVQCSRCPSNVDTIGEVTYVCHKEVFFVQEFEMFYKIVNLTHT